jgi:hypothetical protein
LRRAGVQFDAVRVDGDEGRELARMMDSWTGGDPGPVIQKANAARGTYFLLPVDSTLRRVWPVGVTRYNATPWCFSYVPVPALEGNTWPLTWFCEPLESGRFVHPLLLRHAAMAVLG